MTVDYIGVRATLSTSGKVSLFGYVFFEVLPTYNKKAAQSPTNIYLVSNWTDGPAPPPSIPYQVRSL